jgi:hypothetical protein
MHYNELNECRLVAILMYQNFRYKGKDEERRLAALVECHRNIVVLILLNKYHYVSLLWLTLWNGRSIYS